MAARPHSADPAQGLQDSRYGRFGLLLGIGVAVAIHLLLFVLPSPRLEDAKEKDTERGMVARAYRANPFPLPGSGSGAPPPAARPAPTPGEKESSAPHQDAAPARISDARLGAELVNLRDVPSATGSVTQSGEESGGSKSEYQGSGGVTDNAPPTLGGGGQGGSGAGGGDTGGSGTGQGAAGSGSGQAADWDRVMSMLADKRQELTTREATLKTEREKQVAAVAKPQAVAKKQEDNFLDPRIRMSVVSYPPTAIERKFPPVGYPDIRFRRSQIEAGICRVYLRVYTDSVGRVTKVEIKTPTDKASQEKYEPFITSVKNSVATWPFEAVEAQVHVDVLFEIN